jgi:hypothetical protein
VVYVAVLGERSVEVTVVGRIASMQPVGGREVVAVCRGIIASLFLLMESVIC